MSKFLVKLVAVNGQWRLFYTQKYYWRTVRQAYNIQFYWDTKV